MPGGRRLIGSHDRPYRAKGVLRTWLVDRGNHISILFEAQKIKGAKPLFEMPANEFLAQCRLIESALDKMEDTLPREIEAEGSGPNNA